MLLYYYKHSGGNFGDNLNPYIWPKLLPGFIHGHRYTTGSGIAYRDTDSLFVGIGTLLKHTIPKRPRKFIFGAGCGYGKVPKIDDRWAFYCVRGPLTAKALGISSNYVLSDPAILLRLLDLPPAPKKSRPAFFPHHVSVYPLVDRR